nr:hypothetical protein [Providencia rettgeri]
MAITHNYGLEDVASSGGLITVEGMWYNKTDLRLDGYRFIRCRFDACNLTVETARFELVDCFIDASNLTYFSNDIAKVIRLFNYRNEAMYFHAPYFAPLKNPDGTISITGLSHGA